MHGHARASRFSWSVDMTSLATCRSRFNYVWSPASNSGDASDVIPASSLSREIFRPFSAVCLTVFLSNYHGYVKIFPFSTTKMEELTAGLGEKKKHCASPQGDRSRGSSGYWSEARTSQLLSHDRTSVQIIVTKLSVLLSSDPTVNSFLEGRERTWLGMIPAKASFRLTGYTRCKDQQFLGFGL